MIPDRFVDIQSHAREPTARHCAISEALRPREVVATNVMFHTEQLSAHRVLFYDSVRHFLGACVTNMIVEQE